MITKEEINSMSPEELEAFKRQASLGIAKKFGMILLFKVGTHILLRQLVKRLRD